MMARSSSRRLRRISEITRFFVGVASLTIVCGLWLLVGLVTVVPVVQGWSSVTVLSGSMAPAIDPGDFVLARSPHADDLHPGSVIVYTNPAGRGLITHRIVDRSPTGDAITRGDANRRIDSTPVPRDSINGVGLILVPYIGQPFVWFNEGDWLRLLLTATGVLGVLWASCWGLLAAYDPWRTDDWGPPTDGTPRSMPNPSVVLGILAVITVAAGSLVGTTSLAAFSSTGSNSGNSFTAAASFGNISLVTSAVGATAGSENQATASYATAPTLDNLLVLVHHQMTDGTVELPAGWVEAVANGGGQSGRTTVAYKIAGASEPTDVSVGLEVQQTLSIFEYSGIDTISPVDRTASDSANNVTSCSTGTTATTTTADELLIGAVGLEGASGGWANTWTNGFTQQTTAESTVDPANSRSTHTTAHRIVSATGAYETTESWTTSSKCNGAIATFAGDGGTISQVDSAVGVTAGAERQATANYGATPTTGNLLVLVHHQMSGDPVELPPGWTEAVAATATGDRLTIAYKIAGVSEPTEVAVGPAAAQTLSVFEYSGIDTVSPLDRTASNSANNATSCSTGTTATTTTAEQLLVGAVSVAGASGGWANTWTNGFTQQTTAESTVDPANGRSAHATADRIVLSTGAYETTESWTTTRRCIGTIATFKAAP